MNCTRCVGSRDLQIGSFINPTAEYVAANVVALVFLRFMLVKASVEQDQGGNSPFCYFSYHPTTHNLLYFLTYLLSYITY